jgi:anti-sigma regulatory factor (Ser/Thr protein kinase)
MPYHFAILGCVVQLEGLTHIKVPNRHEIYAVRMHLWQSLGLAPPRTVNESDAQGRFHPLAPIISESSAQDLADAVAHMFRVAGTSDELTLRAIGISLSEIFSNCYFHAETATQICGLACAQSWPGGKRAQVAVADIGIGIRNSLAKNPAYAERLSNANANEMATELGVTGKPQGSHSGYGLAIARQLMERHGGNLLLLSGNEAFRATQDRLERASLQPAWPGTILILEWHTGRPLDIGKVYAGWPKLGDVDDFVD